MFTALVFGWYNSKKKKRLWVLLSFLEKQTDKTQKYSQKEMILALKHVLVNVTDIVIKRYLLKIRGET